MAGDATENVLERRLDQSSEVARSEPGARADREIDQIRASIDETRRQIARDLASVRQDVEYSLDWRSWVRQYPWQSVGIAFGAGFILGLK